MQTKQLYDGANQPFYPRTAGTSIINIGGGIGTVINKNIISFIYDRNTTLNNEPVSEIWRCYDIYINGNKLDIRDYNITILKIYDLLRPILSLGCEINLVAKTDYISSTDKGGEIAYCNSLHMKIDDSDDDENNHHIELWFNDSTESDYNLYIKKDSTGYSHLVNIQSKN